MKATEEYNKMKKKLPSYKEVSVTKAIDDDLLSSLVENDTLGMFILFADYEGEFLISYSYNP
jgi:hypothetical protein